MNSNSIFAGTTTEYNEYKVVDPVEGCEVKESRIFIYLCKKYQLDEHRPVVVDAFCAACLTAIGDSLLGKEVQS